MFTCLFSRDGLPRRLKILARPAQLAAACLLSLPVLALSPQPQLPLEWNKPVVPAAWRPATVTSNFPQGQPVQLREVSVDVQVFGGQAQTRIELRLFNPNPRVLEGELQFPLLDGQVVTGFALDVNGTLRDAVPVPKAKGQEIFEDIRRRRVDPGLLEATAGNQYKLRVYPIAALAERRVSLTVTEALPGVKDGVLLRVPLAFASSVGRLNVRVQASGVARGDARLLQAPEGTEWIDGRGQGDTLPRESTGVQLVRSGWTAPAGPAGWLQLVLRQSNRTHMMVGESGGKRFFAGQVPFKDEPVRRADPKHIALVWDASGSAAAQSRVLPVLDAWFRAMRQPVKVSLIVMRNRPEPVRSFTVTPDGFAALAAVLRAEPADGSSNFDILPIPPGVDATVMVSDGLMTDGKRLINYAGTAPVFAINGAGSADLPRLARLADRTGGALVDAALLPPDEAVRAMLFDGWRVAGLSSLDANHLVLPSLRVQEGRISVAGEMEGATARVEVALSHPDGRRQTRVLSVGGPASAGRWPAQQWAQWRGSELAENPALHAAELRSIASAHGIVGPNSSLIVLELAADYARYELPAPPELAAEVAQLGQLQLAQSGQMRRGHIEAMVRQMEQKQSWWDRDFPKDAPRPAEQKKKEVQGAVGNLGDSAPGMAAAQANALARREAESSSRVLAERPPSAPPAPVAAAPARMEARRDMASDLAAKAASADQASAQSTIALQGWTPDAPYFRRLRDASPSDLYRTYLDERATHQASSSFYLDAAGILLDRGQVELGLRVLSNLAEMNLENRQLLRLYAYRLQQARRADLAVPVFERVSELAPNEPQSWRDLGLALAESGQAQRGVNALWEVVSRPWNGRFAGVGMIALAELNAIAAQASAAGEPLDLARVDTRLRRNLPLALRVVMAWDTDDTDIDMWVTDPNNERASYANRLTFQGGAMSPDATGGYGPEEYSLKSARPGKYRIEAQFYGNQQQVLSAGTTVMVRVTTGFGTPQARDEWTRVRLTHGREVSRIAEVDVR
ncbi:MAG: DUF2135 domain-containing protein [Burkholderiales bacterium]|nr:MAG: DUF2135 domain-containing protein [Burkholderiales bacterium]